MADGALKPVKPTVGLSRPRPEYLISPDLSHKYHIEPAGILAFYEITHPQAPLSLIGQG